METQHSSSERLLFIRVRTGNGLLLSFRGVIKIPDLLRHRELFYTVVRR